MFESLSSCFPATTDRAPATTYSNSVFFLSLFVCAYSENRFSPTTFSLINYRTKSARPRLRTWNLELISVELHLHDIVLRAIPAAAAAAIKSRYIHHACPPSVDQRSIVGRRLSRGRDEACRSSTFCRLRGMCCRRSDGRTDGRTAALSASINVLSPDDEHIRSVRRCDGVFHVATHSIGPRRA